MGGRKDISKDGAKTQFGKGQPTNKGGRPKKIYTILKEMGYSKDDVKTCFGELLWYNKEDLLKISSDNTKPIIVQITAKALIESQSSGDISKIKEILEHNIGKANQTIDMTTNEIKPLDFKIIGKNDKTT